MTMEQGADVQGRDANNADIEQIINRRTDCGFPGIPKFQCVAIRGCCWDDTIYPQNIKVPQCYKPIDLVPPSIFKIVDVPDDLRAEPGTCASNFFRLPQLYYEREACNYELDFFKYDGIADGLTVLDQPNDHDCVFKLGCCWEDDIEILRKYPNTPRCYKKQRNNIGDEVTNPIGINKEDLVARSTIFTTD